MERRYVIAAGILAVVVLAGLYVLGLFVHHPGEDDALYGKRPGEGAQTDGGTGENVSRYDGDSGSNQSEPFGEDPEGIEEGERSFLFYPPKDCVSDPSPVFTERFTDLSRIDVLGPIGDIGGASPGRSYIAVEPGEEVPVYSPTNATIDRITFADRGAGYGEYGVSFWASCEVYVLFDHLDRLSERLKEHAPETASNTTATGDAQVDLPVAAGELIGYTDGTEVAGTFDFLLLNSATKVRYINPDRFSWDQSLYADCPYDYFTDELKDAYYGKLGLSSPDGIVLAEDCGSPSHDVAGTASGAWFIGENSTEFDGKYLRIVRYVNQARIALKDETLEDREDIRFQLRVTEPEHYPAEIEVGEEHCYEEHRGEDGPWAYLNVLPDQRLSLAYGTTGGCPVSFPQSQAETWTR